jgi:MFS family permease
MLANALVVLPVFLTGALSVFMRRDLGFGEGRLGLAISMYFTSAALASVPGGRLAERLGASRALVLAAAVSGLCMVGLAVATRSWSHLAALLVLVGLSSGFGQPASNLAVARLAPEDRQGLAFGVKQGAIPVATMLAGLMVPLIAVPFGWRWGFAAGALAAVPLGLAAAHLEVGAPVAPADRRRDTPARLLALLAGAVAVGTAGVTAVGSFYVESATAGGVSPSTAGALFSLGSGAGFVARILWGWVADLQQEGRLRDVALLMLAGAVGVAVLGIPQPLIMLAVATVIVFALGWGWTGLFNFAVVRLNPRAPAAATGITQSGVYVGGIVGPLGFGALVEATSYRIGWLVAGAALVAAAALVTVARRAVLADRDRVATARPTQDAP